MKSGTTLLTLELSHVSKSRQGRPDKVHSKGAAAGDQKDWEGGEKGTRRKGPGEGEGEMNPGCTHRRGAAPTPWGALPTARAPGSQGLLKA